MILKVKNLTIEIPNDRPLIEKLNMVLKKNDKMAVIGEEGNGKSTLLKVINNREEVEEYSNVSGEISKEGLVLGYLEQSLDPDWDNTKTYEFFLRDEPNEENDYERYIQFSEIGKILSKLKIPTEILESDQTIGTLSGGEKVKIQMAKLLSKEPDVLLLDEPTNDLDLETLEWLEQFIVEQEIPVLFVSHDETLLENTANTILHLEQVKNRNEARHTLENVDYKTYVEERRKKIAKAEQLASMESREYKKDKDILSQQKSAVRTAQINIKDSTVRRGLNKKMKNILVKERKAKEKKKTEKIETEEPIKMDFLKEAEIPRGKVVLDFNLPELKIGDRLLSKNIELNVVGPEKVAIVGANGIGKTTLMRKIKKELSTKEGIKVGYMPQDYSEVLEEDKTVLEYLLKDLDDYEISEIARYMGRIKLTWQEMNGEIKALSQGQKAKIIILKMILSGKNVLLFDEPTRNLSSLSNPVIRDILKEYKGSIIGISHDRKFLKEVCNKIYKLNENGLEQTKI